MRDIAHWMAFPVTQEEWWLAGALVARPNTPAAVPIYGNYEHWVAVNGYAVSNNPVPYPHTNPWETPDFTVYGFWLTDPVSGGIGEHVYVTAAEAQATYFLPLSTGDIYNGRYLQVAEPPAIMSNVTVTIAEPAIDLMNLEFIGSEVNTDMAAKTQMLITNNSIKSFRISSPKKSDRAIMKKSWMDIVDYHILSDPEVVVAFNGTKMQKPLLVHRLDNGDDYYLIRFNRGKLTSGVIMLDANEGYFEQASWTDEPIIYLPIKKNKAIKLVFEYETRFGNKKLGKKILNMLKKNMLKNSKVDAKLVWKSSLSPSPFYPVWMVSAGDKVWFVAQNGTVSSKN